MPDIDFDALLDNATVIEKKDRIPEWDKPIPPKLVQLARHLKAEDRMTEIPVHGYEAFVQVKSAFHAAAHSIDASPYCTAIYAADDNGKPIRENNRIIGARLGINGKRPGRKAATA